MLTAALSDAEITATRPSKSDLKRLTLLLSEWRMQESNLESHYGPPLRNSMRHKRIKDAAALQTVLDFCKAKCKQR